MIQVGADDWNRLDLKLPSALQYGHIRQLLELLRHAVRSNARWNAGRASPRAR